MTIEVKPDPIQEQLIQARRNQILDAATQVFAEKGFHRATIKDVAKAAGIADGTIYNYFENKTGLMLGLLDRLNETPQRPIDFGQAAQGDVRAWVRIYLRRRIEMMKAQELALLRVLISEMLVNEELRELYFKTIVKPTYDLAEAFFKQWQADGIMKLINSALLMRVITGTFLGVLLLHMLGDSELQARWDELPDVVADIVMYGSIQGEEDHE